MSAGLSGTCRLLAAAGVLLGNGELAALLACSVLLGLTTSFVMPYMSLFCTREMGMSLSVFGLFMTTP